MNLQFLIPAGRAILGQDYITALDIGGAYGLQSHWTRFIGNSFFYMFEPHEQSYKDLLEMYKLDPFGKMYCPLPYALAEKDGPTKFYATNVPTGSSLLKPNKNWRYHSDTDPYYYPMKELDIQGHSLKTVLDQSDVKNIDIIKMDIQGAELAVLKGLDAERLNHTLLIELEVLFEPFYENSCKLSEVENFLSNHGMEMYDIRVVRSARKIPAIGETYNKMVFGVSNQDPSISQKIGEVDCIYFRKPEQLIKAKDISKLNKLIFVFGVYNFFADAMLLLDDMLTNSLVDQVRYNQIKEILVQWQKLNKQQLVNFEKVMSSLDWQNYAQYTWTPYPST